MSSPTITKEIREKIMKDAVRKTYEKQAQAFEAELRELALEFRDNLFSNQAERDAFDLLTKVDAKTRDRKYLETNYLIRTNHQGQSVYLYFSGNLSTIDSSISYLVGTDMSHVNLTMPNRMEHSYVPNAKQSQRLEKLMVNLSKFKDEVLETKLQLMAILESVRTFKKLRSVWLEGEIFYNIYDVDNEKSPNLPAPIITSLNKRLGL